MNLRFRHVLFVFAGNCKVRHSGCLQWNKVCTEVFFTCTDYQQASGSSEQKQMSLQTRCLVRGVSLKRDILVVRVLTSEDVEGFISQDVESVLKMSCTFAQMCLYCFGIYGERVGPHRGSGSLSLAFDREGLGFSSTGVSVRFVVHEVSFRIRMFPQ
jgi:hypothetical protein